MDCTTGRTEWFNLGQIEVVCGDGSCRSLFQKMGEDSLDGNVALPRVGALEDFIEEKQDLGVGLICSVTHQVDNFFESLEFGEEKGDSLVEH